MLFLFLPAVLFIAGCKTKTAVQPGLGAYVTIDGTDDGLEHIQTEFKDASRTSDGILVNLSSDVLFAINSANLSLPAKKELDKVVSLLNKNKSRKIQINGHTDSTGPSAFNQTLSENRAKAVKTYLVSKGMQSSQITTKGFGASQPIASNQTNEGKLKNRRVEIIILDSAQN